MRTNFEPSLKFVLESEGGNDDDPVDRGGRTSRGITQREYDAWCRLHKSPSGDVWKATTETIQSIYYQEYWLPHGDMLPVGMDYLYFDACVLHGSRRATVFMQQCLNVPADGHFGLVTMDAAVHANVKVMIECVSDKKRAFYRAIERSNPSQMRFDKGWMSRVNAVHKQAMAMMS